jgi:DNA primase large subunit
MPTVRFYLRSRNTNPSAIMARLYYLSKEFPVSTGQSVDPAKWNQEKQRVEKTADADAINLELTNFKTTLLNKYAGLQKEVTAVTNPLLRAKLEGKETGQPTAFYRHIENVIERRRQLGVKNKNGTLYLQRAKRMVILQESMNNKIQKEGSKTVIYSPVKGRLRKCPQITFTFYWVL